MAIRQKQYCDICEQIHGEESPLAEINVEEGRPAFPQLTWVFHRLSNVGFKKADGEPYMDKVWKGGAFRREFCDEHAREMNVLLKAYFAQDSDLMELIDKLKETDQASWDESQEAVRQEVIKEFSKYAKRN
ncbi:MAG: hypothetical protein CMB99_15965 [Flavobacteriaceae bacterium]|jgi:hypothetical protein|nr:hypothetical protein [Flavobacteriaceae bacterium]|tara:strand:+ start:15647 stop:16039 length:393 start_codon:yes stop_codon:yes gene_type:complete